MAEERNFAPFPYDPKTIDAVIVGHAHLDHTGRLPKLVKEVFRGRIYVTAPTAELTRLVLDDSEKLMREEARREGHPVLYGRKEIEETIQLFEDLPYDEPLEIFPGIRLTFKNAGHILGSAITVIESEGKTLVYTSDLGNAPSELLSPPDEIPKADFIITETTYGARIHEPLSERHQKLADIIKSVVATNGVLMIPAFAIERTQELLHDIEHFCNSVNCAVPTFYLDSPLAAKVTRVFEKYPEYLKPNLSMSHEDTFGLSRLVITQTVEQSKEINDVPGPKIILAGSGMLNGGRILHHLTRYIEGSVNALLIVGYQAMGTLGRRLLEGEKRVRIFNKDYQVHARVLAIGSYSAHADSVQLLDWIGAVNGVQRVFLVHGDSEQAVGLALRVESELHLEAVIPQQGEVYEL